jgi:hypothetical protein
LVTSGIAEGDRLQLVASMARAGLSWWLVQRRPDCQPAPKAFSSGVKNGLVEGALVLGAVVLALAVGGGVGVAVEAVGVTEGLADGLAVTLGVALVVAAPPCADQKAALPMPTTTRASATTVAATSAILPATQVPEPVGSAISSPGTGVGMTASARPAAKAPCSSRVSGCAEGSEDTHGGAAGEGAKGGVDPVGGDGCDVQGDAPVAADPGGGNDPAGEGECDVQGDDPVAAEGGARLGVAGCASDDGGVGVGGEA